jgi:hypothetical protein
VEAGRAGRFLVAEARFLRTSIALEELIEKSELVFHESGYAFLKHNTRDVAEFEVLKPEYFRVYFERRKDPKARNMMFILPPKISQNRGTEVRLAFDLDQSQESVTAAEAYLRSYVTKLVASLSAKPWDGLERNEREKEKKKWEALVGSGKE